VKEQRVIQVFVGSPGDVAEARKRAFEVIESINDDVLLPAGWRFEGVGWDQTHYPKLAWLSPQEAINQGLPQPGDCDIAVFMFWKRVGTPTVFRRLQVSAKRTWLPQPFTDASSFAKAIVPFYETCRMGKAQRAHQFMLLRSLLRFQCLVWASAAIPTLRACAGISLFGQSSNGDRGREMAGA
jgi:hypothetical protein